jgi:hypothetical protein
MPRKGSQASSPGSGRYAALGHVQGGSYADALKGSGELWERVFTALCNQGDAMIVGRTRDGSALFLRILSEDGNAEFYEGSSSGLCSTLYGIAEAAEGS